MYYLVASSPHSVSLAFSAMVVVKRGGSDVGLTVLHGEATSSGTVIAINNIPWYSNVVRIMLAYNDN